MDMTNKERMSATAKNTYREVEGSIAVKGMKDLVNRQGRYKL
jgi:hypothetical protein